MRNCATLKEELGIGKSGEGKIGESGGESGGGSRCKQQSQSDREREGMKNQGNDQYPRKKKGRILGTLVGLGKLIEMAEESSTPASWNGGYVNV